MISRGITSSVMLSVTVNPTSLEKMKHLTKNGKCLSRFGSKSSLSSLILILYYPRIPFQHHICFSKTHSESQCYISDRSRNSPIASSQFRELEEKKEKRWTMRNWKKHSKVICKVKTRNVLVIFLHKMPISFSLILLNNKCDSQSIFHSCHTYFF